MADKPAHGTICWNELMTTDVDSARKFYSDLIGWQIKDSGIMPGMQYNMLMAGETQAGGLMAMPPEAEGVPSHWVAYITVDDVDGLVEKTTSLGGKILHGPQDIPNIGRFMIVQDPTSAVIGLIKLAG